jgi:PilZ domain
MVVEPLSPWRQPQASDNRAFERVELHVSGQLFEPLSESTFPCRVTCLSPGGAGVDCSEAFDSNVPLVLYIDGFGRFDGRVVPHNSENAPTKFGLSFSLSKAKQERVREMVTAFLRDGLPAVTQMRQNRRVRTNGLVQLQLVDGRMIDGELIDISLDGVSLRTSARPPLGDVVSFGQTKGQIVRYHDEGIALRFVRDVAPGPTVSSLLVRSA